MDPAYCLWIPPFAPGVWEETEFIGYQGDDKKSEAYKSAESLALLKQNQMNKKSAESLSSRKDGVGQLNNEALSCIGDRSPIKVRIRSSVRS